MICRSINIGVCLLVSLALSGSVGADDFMIQIQRYRELPSATLGTLHVGIEQEELCNTLEPPFQNNEEDISSIPAGKYSASLRYDGPRGWRIQLQDVPDRTVIQIHLGNFPRDTKGCVLVGLDVDEDVPQVTDSAGAIKKLKKYFYGTEEPNQTPNREITVTIVDP